TDGQFAAIGEFDGILSLWKTDTGKQLRQTRLFSDAADNTPVWSLGFRADNRQVLALCNQKLVSWDVQSGNETVVLDGTSASSLATSPDGRYVATNDLQLWDLETRQRVRTFVGFPGRVSSLCFSPDGRQILSGGEKDVFLWDVETGDQIRRF